jgi:biopolymer transport protein TolR
MAFRTDDEELGALSEINVTPLVDVMLVLLVIFMVTAPLLTQGLDVQLPKAEGKNFESTSNKPSTVSIQQTGVVYLDGKPLGAALDLQFTLGSALKAQHVQRALLEADQSVPYGRVIQVIDVMKNAGVEQLGMVTLPAERGDAGRSR